MTSRIPSDPNIALYVDDPAPGDWAAAACMTAEDLSHGVRRSVPERRLRAADAGMSAADRPIGVAVPADARTVVEGRRSFAAHLVEAVAGAVGGIASVVGEIFLKERFAALRKQPRKKHYFPFIVMVVVFLILRAWHPQKNIYNTAVAFAVCALMVALLRRDLILTMIVGAVIFTILYFALFLYFLSLYRNFVDLYYNLANLSGIRLLGVPIEELMFAASGGAVWSVAYEYLQGYRFAPGRGFRLVEA